MPNSKHTLPTILVIFGATGDLARNKLIPSLFHLYQKKLLPSYFQVVGFSRRELNDQEFKEMAEEAAMKKAGASLSEAKEFIKFFTYRSGSFTEKKGYYKLAEYLGMKDEEWHTCANKLFYLAVPPEYYRSILINLASSGMTKPCSPEEGWTRVVVEKPFGKNQKNAEELDRLLGSLFKEEQIYRIDHYLGKETVQNILAFRFSNSFLEPAWDNNSIEKITVRILQSSGVEGRGEFYDSLGALRDVGQNHLLQLLALFTMENPLSFNTNAIREGRARILKALRRPSSDDVKKYSIRGQYDGYLHENGVAKDSKTETYFKIQAILDLPRWRGVPLILESGKALHEDVAEVVITFKHPSPCLCPAGRPHYENTLKYSIQPQEKISISFWVKKPGLEMALEEKDFYFDYQGAYAGEKIADAYERLLLDVIMGNQTLFVSTEEIIASWKFTDPYIRVWHHDKEGLIRYDRGDKKIRLTSFGAASLEKKLGYIGLGKMGRNMVLRMQEQGWSVKAFDADEGAREKALGDGIEVSSSIEEVVRNLPSPRLVWIMVPAGDPVDNVLFGENGVVQFLDKGDIVVDGGNSFYEDTLRRAKKLKQKGILFLDAGVSGGPKGARHGACIMVGGDRKVYDKLESLFRELSVAGGYAYMGKAGSGHFVKMVHNGIEYGMMQSLAEGFAILKKSPFDLELKKIAELYNHGSVIESRLVQWLWEAYAAHGNDLASISGSVGHTGEGEWTAKTAKKFKVPDPIIEGSFKFRVKSKKHPSYIGQILSALRHQFGGHDAKGK